MDYRQPITDKERAEWRRQLTAYEGRAVNLTTVEEMVAFCEQALVFFEATGKLLAENDSLRAEVKRLTRAENERDLLIAAIECVRAGCQDALGNLFRTLDKMRGMEVIDECPNYPNGEKAREQCCWSYLTGPQLTKHQHAAQRAEAMRMVVDAARSASCYDTQLGAQAMRDFKAGNPPSTSAEKLRQALAALEAVQGTQEKPPCS